MVKAMLAARRAAQVIKGVAVVLIAVFISAAGQTYAQVAANSTPSIDTDSVAKWLKQNAVPLKSVVAGSGFADLQPLKKVLKDVKIVGLGESTHGTREFFQFKHRMLEFLVKEMGYTVFAIEASYPACLNINDYVVYGKGDRAAALASQGFWTWDTNEVSDMIDWMREYNKNLPEAKRIKFLGYDMQNYGHAYDRLYPYLKRVAADYLEKVSPDSLPAQIAFREFMGKSNQEKEQLKSKVNQLIEFLTVNKDRLVKASSSREYEESLQCARVMFQFADAFTRPSGRDYYMAKNTEYILNSEGPKTKIVSWAHNWHISYRDGAMGRFLRQTYGNGYYALAFSFNQGGFQSRNMDPQDKENAGLVEFTLGPASEGMVDWYLAKAGIKNYVVDLRYSNKPPPVATWLSTTLPMHDIGSGFAKTWTVKEYALPTALKELYDGVIFIDTTTRARPNPTGVRK